MYEKNAKDATFRSKSYKPYMVHNTWNINWRWWEVVRFFFYKFFIFLFHMGVRLLSILTSARVNEQHVVSRSPCTAWRHRRCAASVLLSSALALSKLLLRLLYNVNYFAIITWEGWEVKFTDTGGNSTNSWGQARLQTLCQRG